MDLLDEARTLHQSGAVVLSFPRTMASTGCTCGEFARQASDRLASSPSSLSTGPSAPNLDLAHSASRALAVGV